MFLKAKIGKRKRYFSWVEIPTSNCSKKLVIVERGPYLSKADNMIIPSSAVQKSNLCDLKVTTKTRLVVKVVWNAKNGSRVGAIQFGNRELYGPYRLDW